MNFAVKRQLEHAGPHYDMHRFKKKKRGVDGGGGRVMRGGRTEGRREGKEEDGNEG
jgi:hypothetical protein